MWRVNKFHADKRTVTAMRRVDMPADLLRTFLAATVARMTRQLNRSASDDKATVNSATPRLRVKHPAQ